MEDKDFIDYYRKIVEQGSETTQNSPWTDTPMDSDIDDVWNKVSLELDIDEVWNNVSVKLNEDKKKKNIRLVIAWSSAAVVFFMIGLFIFEYKSIENQQSSQIVKVEQTLSKTIDKTTNNNVNKNSIESKNDKSNNQRGVKVLYSDNAINRDVSEKENNKIVDTLIQVEFSKSVNNNPLENNPDSLFLTGLAVLDAKDVTRMISYLPTDEIISELMYSDNNILSSPSKYSLKGRFSIGISNAIKNTWLINRETKEGFNRNDLKTTKLSFLPDIGVNIKYAFSNKWSTEVSGFFSSSIGQTYNEYVYGDYSRKNIKLRYASFEGSVKYSNYKPKILKDISFNSIVGLYFSRLRSANQTIGGEKKSVYSQYTNIDYGIILGQEIELYIFNRISIAPGVRLKIGVPNVYRGYSERPSSLHRTQNASLDFRFSIYYKLYK